MGRISWEHSPQAAANRSGHVKARSAMAAHIGSKLLQLRQERQLTQGDVAEMIGVGHRAQICHMENGDSCPQVASLWKLSKALDVPIDYWFEGYLDVSLEETV